VVDGRAGGRPVQLWKTESGVTWTAAVRRDRRLPER
jgi:hypothetical protein